MDKNAKKLIKKHDKLYQQILKELKTDETRKALVEILEIERELTLLEEDPY